METEVRRDEEVSQGFRFWIAKHRYILTIISVGATVMGIYINAALNFAHLLSDRSKIAYDRLEAINIVKSNSFDISARACFDYAGIAHLDKKFIAAMWRDYANNPNLLPTTTDQEKLYLYRCLSPEIHPINADLVAALGVDDNQAKTYGKIKFNAVYARIIFNYLNAFEPSANMAQENRMDTEVFCNEIRDMLDERGDMLDFVKSYVLTSVDKKSDFSNNYPGLYWFVLKGDTYCNDKSARHFDNTFEVLFPFLSRPQSATEPSAD